MSERGPAAEAVKRYWSQVYVPSTLVWLGDGMLASTLALYLFDRGLSAGDAGWVLAADGFGAVLATLPVGVILSRRPVRSVVLVAGLVTAMSVALLGTTASLPALLALRMVAGGGIVSWVKGQETYLFRRLDPMVRGRSLAVLAATDRAALFVGPMLGGALATAFGSATAFAVTGAVIVVGVVVLYLAPQTAPRTLESTMLDVPHSMRTVVRENRHTLATLGSAEVGITILRKGLRTLLAFRAAQLGMDEQSLGFVMSAMFAVDFFCFPLAGHVLDRHGRLAAIVPAYLLLSAATSMVWAADSTGWLLVVGLVAGVGNGMSTGTLLAVNSDMAPADAPGQFLGAMGCVAATGDIAGPKLVSELVARLSIGAASGVIAAFGVGAVAIFAFVVGETRDRAHAYAASLADDP